MQKLFNKILVPIDFSTRSRKAVLKAVEIANEYKCSIHLLHVIPFSPFTAVAGADGHSNIPLNLITNNKELNFMLEKMCNKVAHKLEGSNKISYSVANGYFDESIINHVNEFNYDLVIIGQKGRLLGKRKMLLNPNKIAKESNAPVITVPANRRLTHLYSLVIPITDFLPVRKLLYGIYIASTYKTTIKLLGVKNDKTNEQVEHYLEKAAELIRSNCTINVELDTIMSNNVAEAVNQFAMLQSADLVILNPGIQTKMPGLLSTFFGNIIQKYSSPPVLTVNPV